MILKVKNKDTLLVDDFIFKCSTGKKGLKKSKKEGDKCTPIGLFSLGKIYYRPDRLDKPDTNLKIIPIKKNMGWCDDPKSKYYNREISLPSRIKHERLYKKDRSYDLLLVINYNTTKTIPYKGSAIFLHLTSNYKKTNGCIAVSRKDLYIILKLINKKSKIKIY